MNNLSVSDSHEMKAVGSMTRITLLLLSSLVVMAGASVSATLPAIQDHFRSVPNIGFLVRLLQTFPALFIVISAPIAGILIDRQGRKRILILGTILYGITGVSAFFMRSIWGILVSRALLGIGSAIIYTDTTALISDYFEDQERAKFLGVQTGVMAMSGVVFPLLGGILTDIGWNFTFLTYGAAFLYLPLAFIFIFEPFRVADQKNHAHQKLNWLSAIPSLPLTVIFGLTFLGQIIFFVTPVQLPFYLRDLNISSSIIISVFVAAISLSMSLSGFAYGWVKKQLSYPLIVSLSFGLAAIGYLMSGIYQHHGVIMVGILVAGFGLGLNNPNMVSWLADFTPESLRGRVLGSRLTFNFLGQFLSPIVVQPLIAANGIPSAYIATAVLSGLIMFISLSVGGFTRKKTDD
jgi:MFS family permease